eukprot:TRINITY_DN61740_c0_g2_i1.p2 TRINITY_DN61740_c0_g2~~TRINITY_DN61740_c0_g2_i1.p2  ORF type:complete len:106 (+),score=21.62 TRINITY_DN61740_c0_g2_i1:88-405(+)
MQVLAAAMLCQLSGNTAERATVVKVLKAAGKNPDQLSDEIDHVLRVFGDNSVEALVTEGQAKMATCGAAVAHSVTVVQESQASTTEVDNPDDAESDDEQIFGLFD